MPDASTSDPEAEPQATHATNVSGGVNVDANQVTIGGDVVGRDKITSIIHNIRNIDLRFFPVAAVFLVIIIVLLYLLLRPTHPEKMTGEFNLAVADIAVQDASGSPINSSDGKALADFIYHNLDRNFKAFDLQNVSYELWPPDDTGRVEGSTAEDRELRAKALAERINAHVVIYGTIVQRDGGAEFSPEYYVNYQGFGKSPELTGQYTMGLSLPVQLPFKVTGLVGIENSALSARASALSLIAIGLAYYSIDNYEQALTYFHQAEQISGWSKNAGKEIVYWLIGSAEAHLVNQRKSLATVPAATMAYTTALTIKPDYARAQIGLGGALYLQALKDPTKFTLETVDQDKLAEAERAFEAARDMSAPRTANVPTKISSGLGQIYDLRGQIGLGEEWTQKAKVAYQQVITDFQNGNASVGELAGQAYERLGYIAAVFEHNLPLAIEYYQKAVKLVTPFYQAKFNAKLGEVYLMAGDKAKAIEVYTEAVRIAEFYGDSDSAEEYGKRLRELQSNK